MFTALRKLKKRSEAQKETELENTVAHAIFDIEVNNKDLKYALQPISFVSAREIKISKTRSAIIIFVPRRELQQYQEIHTKLVRELEKKFSGKHILIVAQRRALQKRTSSLIHRPRARTLKVVNENIMKDICYPAEISGLRTRVKTDGSEHLKIFLDPSEKVNLEGKLSTFSVAYRKLTGKTSSFQFAE
uniref:40S ribosomal protein S7 n=1 Tax=Percolomonas cosmopolitus TaxID=63605 RepID=A0A7S1KUP6_9EUKA